LLRGGALQRADCGVPPSFAKQPIEALSRFVSSCLGAASLLQQSIENLADKDMGSQNSRTTVPRWSTV
jgi:hypothetical protein